MAIRLFEHNQTAYNAAVAMLAETGKAAVIHPTGMGKSFIGFKLGNWIAHLRQRRLGKGKGAALTREQIMRLEQIGMVWDPEQHRFESELHHAQDCYKQHGHLRVPVSFCCEDGFSLGRWIRLKRRQYDSGTMPIENVRSLEVIGMLWDVFSEVWSEMCLQAKAYYDCNGNLEVPRNYTANNGKRLDLWVCKCGRERASLSGEQIKMLDAIGFRWEKRAS